MQLRDAVSGGGEAVEDVSGSPGKCHGGRPMVRRLQICAARLHSHVTWCRLRRVPPWKKACRPMNHRHPTLLPQVTPSNLSIPHYHHTHNTAASVPEANGYYHHRQCIDLTTHHKCTRRRTLERGNCRRMHDIQVRTRPDTA